MTSTVSFRQNDYNPFDLVSNRNINNNNYWLGATADLPKKDEEITINDILIPEKARKTKNLKAIGISIATATIVITGTILLLLKGGPKGLSKGLEKLRNYYIEKIQTAKLKGEEVSSTAIYLSNKLTVLLGKLEAVNNITTMKDYGFKKLMHVCGKYPKKIHQKITELFERLGRQTVVNSYSNTATKLLKTNKLNDDLIEKLLKSTDLGKQITINGKTLTKKEWITLLSEDIKNIENTFTLHFERSRIDERYKKMKTFTSEVEQTFNDSGNFWFLSKDIFKTFVAKQKMLPKKMHIQVPLKTVRKDISYSEKDLYKDAKSKIMRVSGFINLNDKKALENLNIVHEDIKLFAQKGDISKEKIVTDIDKFLSSFAHSSDPKNKDLISVYQDIIDLKISVINFKHGKTEEILDIYKALLPDEDYQKISKSYQKSIKSIDKSMNLETEDFVDKLRDLTMGSAPTDILTILTGFGTLGYYLAKSDNNKERIGITLKYGIPALTLIGTCLVGNAKLFAGSKSMALGLASSWVVNRIGSAANDLFLKYCDRKNNLTE